MDVVGVDFGTTNVRISAWDSDQDLPPQPQVIGLGADGATTMPAVVALRRLPGGEVSVTVGEEADSEIDEANKTLVIRNIKRHALSNDRYVNRHLEVRTAQQASPRWPPTWWNPEKRCVQVWGQEFPVWDLIRNILAEALRRAGVGEGFEWRAGCPVHAGLDYRRELTRVLTQLTGSGSMNWVVEEPILFLILLDKLGSLSDSRIDGSFLVYDFGGGSFDCALVEFQEDDSPMIVYGADGHPLLGGSDVDDMLTEKLGYRGQPDLMRKAKERLSPDTPSETLADGTVLSYNDLESTLVDGGFVEQSLNSIRDAYMGAKVLWKRREGEDDPPVGEVISRDSKTGAEQFVWQLTLSDLTKDVDEIILFGGPTRAPHFRENLSSRFGDRKIKNASEMLPELPGLADLELVGVSMGACYSYEDSYSPLYVNRLPARVTLENLYSGDKVEYEPFDHLTPNFNPFELFRSQEMPPQPALVRFKTFGETIQLTVTLPNGVVESQTFVDKRVNARLIRHTLQLVIDRLGRVGVIQSSEKAGPKKFTVLEDTPWQTGRQRDALQRLFEQQRVYATRRREKGLFYATQLPWEYPTP